jgi:CheY-like chemotaxis protein
VTTDILERYGYRVLQAADGEAALRVSAEHDGPIDLLLSDVVMPGLSGPELVAQLAPGPRRMKVLCMSGYLDDRAARHGLVPDLPFIHKPITPASLAQRVREVLDSAGREDAIR